MTSCVPPEPILSAWSSSRTGPLGALGRALGARHRLVERLVAVEEIVASRPGGVEQALASRARAAAAIAVGDADRREPGVRRIGEREAAEHRGGEEAASPPRRAPCAISALHRLVVGAHAQGLGEQRARAPTPSPGGSCRRARASRMLADLLADLVHVDMRIGLVADERRAVLDHLVA